MYAFARLGGLVAGCDSRGPCGFHSAYRLCWSLFWHSGIFTSLPANPTAGQALLFNLTVYAIPVLIILFRSGFSDAEPSRSSAFVSSFIVAFPLPAIWLAYAWQSYGASI